MGNSQTVSELHAMISSLKTMVELKEREVQCAKVRQRGPTPVLQGHGCQCGCGCGCGCV